MNTYRSIYSQTETTVEEQILHADGTRIQRRYQSKETLLSDAASSAGTKTAKSWLHLLAQIAIVLSRFQDVLFSVVALLHQDWN